jgi:hypothetical protein
MTARRRKQVLIACAALAGAIVGYLLLQLSIGGRYDFPDKCSPLPGGGGFCTAVGYGPPRSIWVDVAASGIGAAVGVLVAAVAMRSRRAPSANLPVDGKSEATTR